MGASVKRNGKVLKTFEDNKKASSYYWELYFKAQAKGEIFPINGKKFKVYINGNEFVFSLHTCSVTMNN